jgi:hypothetical protein
MKIDDKHIDQLLNVIPDYPNLRIMHFADEHSTLVEKLSALCIKNKYEYQLQCPTETFAKQARTRYPESNIKVRYISLSQSRYHRQAKMYDFVFVEIDVDDITHFLKALYTAMKNASNVFVLYDRSRENREEEWRIEMEKNFYVAYSAFDLNDEIRIISAKKMHGWGG